MEGVACWCREGIACEHMHGVTDEYSTAGTGSGKEHRRDALVLGLFKYQTAFVAGSDVRTALHVAKCSVMCKILTCMVTNGHVVGSTSGGDEGREELCMLRE